MGRAVGYRGIKGGGHPITKHEEDFYSAVEATTFDPYKPKVVACILIYD